MKWVCVRRANFPSICVLAQFHVAIFVLIVAGVIWRSPSVRLCAFARVGMNLVLFFRVDRNEKHEISFGLCWTLEFTASMTSAAQHLPICSNPNSKHICSQLLIPPDTLYSFSNTILLNLIVYYWIWNQLNVTFWTPGHWQVLLAGTCLCLQLFSLLQLITTILHITDHLVWNISKNVGHVTIYSSLL